MIILTFTEFHDDNQDLFVNKTAPVRNNIYMVKSAEQLSLEESLLLFPNCELAEDDLFGDEVLLTDARRWILVFDQEGSPEVASPNASKFLELFFIRY